MPLPIRHATAFPFARLLALLLLFVSSVSLQAEDNPALPYFRALAWTGQAYVGVTTEAVQTSADGVAWNVVHPSTQGLSLVAVGNGRVVAAGDQVLLSAEGGGTAFTFSEYPAAGAKFNRLVFGGGVFVALDEQGRAFVGNGSTDWKTAVVAPGFLFKGLAFGNGHWIAAGGDKNGSAVFTTADPTGTWTRGNIPADTGPYGAAFGEGQFLIAGFKGLLLTSADGKAWESTTSPELAQHDDYTEVFSAGGRFYLHGSALYTPGDGGTWEPVPQPDDTYLQTPLVKDDGLFVILEDADRARSLLAIGEVERQGMIQRHYGEQEYKEEPTPLPAVVVVTTPVPTPAPTLAPTSLPKGVEDEKFATILAEWDRATTAATSAAERQKLCEHLLREWSYSHPGYTFDEAMAFTQALYDRLMNYELSDYSLSHFLLGTAEISNDFSKAYVQTLPERTKTIVNQLMTDIVNDNEAQWNKNIKPHPVRIVSSQKPAQPQVSPAEMDMDELRLKAARGDMAAAYDLNFCYRIGQGVPLDVAAAAFWIRRAQNAGFKQLAGSTGTPEGNFSIFRQGADQGSAMAQHQVALLYRDGQGVTRDVKEAARNFKSAIEKGHLGAACDLAIVYRLGNGIKADPEESLRLLTFASSKGHARSIAELGHSHEIGWSVPRDLKKAAEFYQKAADLGNAWAALRLVDLLLVGEGIPRDEARARTLLQAFAAKGDDAARSVQANLNASKHKATVYPPYTAPRVGKPIFNLAACRAKAEAGDPGACYDMAFACWNSHGIPLEDNLGDQWLAKAKSLGFKLIATTSSPEDGTASWKSVAEQGSMVGLWYWALRLRDGTGCPVDHKAATAVLRKAVDAGNWNAAIDLANQLRYGRGCSADPVAALGVLKTAADQGFDRANTVLAWSYEAGCGAQRDLAKAARYYKKASDAGFSPSTVMLAEYYLCGYGVPWDEVRARELLRKAADQGDLDALPLLELVKEGSYRERALAAFQPPEHARAMFDLEARKTRAEAGDAAACFDMAWATREGFGLEPDESEAAKWLTLAKAKGWKEVPDGTTDATKAAAWKSAAEQGSIAGAFEYAVDLFNGTGTPLDVAGALSWLQKAAAAGHANAQASLAGMYEVGNAVVPKDEAKAVEWYLRAAQAGNAQAQMKVGFYHDSGFHMPVNKELAVQFYQLAAEGGNKVGMANVATLLTTGSGTATNLKAAAGWYLKMAGLLAEPTEPAEAYKQIQIALFDGHPEVLPVLAIMDRRAFGVVLDNTKASSRALASEYFKSAIYPLTWFDPTATQSPAAKRMAADYILDGTVAGVAAWSSGNKAVARAKTMKSFEKIFEDCADPKTSKVASFLRALDAGTLTDAQIAEASRDSEPLNLAGIEPVWAAAKKNLPAGTKPSLLRLAGIGRLIPNPDDAEAAFLGELVANPDSLTEDKILRLNTLRRIQVARRFYGIGCTPDRKAALTWALINSSAQESYSPIAFLLRQLNIAEILDSDVLYNRQSSGANADFPQDVWIKVWIQHAASEAAETANAVPKP